MGKFLIRVLSFVLIVAAISALINCVYLKMDGNDFHNVKKFDSMPDHIKVCNFGSSHGLYGFNYADVEADGTECFNFGLSSQNYSYDLRLFECYKDHIDSGAVVFIPVSYFNLYGIDEREESDFEERNNRYYRFLNPMYIKDFDFRSFLYYRILPVIRDWDNTLNVFEGKSVNDNVQLWSATADEIDLNKNAIHACRNHIMINKFDENHVRRVNQGEVDCLYQLISEVKEAGCTPILVTTPFLREYTDVVKTDTSFFADFYSLVYKISSETGVPYYDYGFDERFIDDHSLFMNSDHLNMEGARIFTDILMEETVN